MRYSNSFVCYFGKCDYTYTNFKKEKKYEIEPRRTKFPNNVTLISLCIQLVSKKPIFLPKYIAVPY